MKLSLLKFAYQIRTKIGRILAAIFVTAIALLVFLVPIDLGNVWLLFPLLFPFVELGCSSLVTWMSEYYMENCRGRFQFEIDFYCAENIVVTAKFLIYFKTQQEAEEAALNQLNRIKERGYFLSSSVARFLKEDRRVFVISAYVKRETCVSNKAVSHFRLGLDRTPAIQLLQS